MTQARLARLFRFWSKQDLQDLPAHHGTLWPVMAAIGPGGSSAGAGAG